MNICCSRSPYRQVYCAILTLAFLASCSQEPLPMQGQTFDAGIKIVGTEIKHEFSIYNSTNRTIEAQDVQTSCACTNATLDKRRLAPGEQTTLSVVIDTAGRLGPMRQGVKIPWTRSGESNSVSLGYYVTADVRSALRSDPPYIKFSEDDVKDGKAVETFIRSNVPVDWKNVVVMATPEDFEVVTHEFDSDKNGLRCAVVCRESGSDQYSSGTLKVSVPMRGDDRDESQLLQIPISAARAVNLSILPKSLIVALDRKNGRGSGNLIIKGKQYESKHDLIESVECPLGNVNWNVENREDSGMLKVEFTLEMEKFVESESLDSELLIRTITGQERRIALFFTVSRMNSVGHSEHAKR